MLSLLDGHLISLITFSPVVWGLLVLVIGDRNKDLVRYVSLVGSLITFVLTLLLWKRFDESVFGFQMAERMQWIPGIGADYFVGVDGISLLLVLLSTMLMPIIVLSSWRYIDKKVAPYFFFMFLLESGMIGAFVALDIFLFYIFWEAMLIPMFFIIGIWGGTDRIYATSKFVLYTVAGSLPMLVAIIYIVWQHFTQFGMFSTALVDLYRVQLDYGGTFSPQTLVFFAFCLAFAVKVPMFPLHTWLPDAHVQAPTGGSVILAGVLLKLGIYGFIRFAMPLCPDVVGNVSHYFMWIAAAAIVYGACVALVQEDAKKLIAYSSVSHMGFIVLGLFSLTEIGISGAVYQMLNHGISTGALFLLVGIMYERMHTRDIVAFSGLARIAPIFTIIFVIITMSSIALPGTNGFIGEFLILQGAFLSAPYVTAVAGLGIILGAVYMLWLCQRILFGVPKDKKIEAFKDIGIREFCYLSPLIILVFVMGLYPRPFFKKMEKSVHYFSEKGMSGNYRPSVSFSFQTPYMHASADRSDINF